MPSKYVKGYEYETPALADEFARSLKTRQGGARDVLSVLMPSSVKKSLPARKGGIVAKRKK